MRVILPLIIALIIIIPAVSAEPTVTIAIYSNVPADGLVKALNSTYVVKTVTSLTAAWDASVIVILAPMNLTSDDAMVVRRLLSSGGLVIITAEPSNETIIQSANDLLSELGLPSLFYYDKIYDFIHNDGNPEHVTVNGSIVYSCSMVDRIDAVWKNYTRPSAVAMKNDSVREIGKLVRGEEIRAYKGMLAAFGGSTMFSDVQYNSTHTRFDINGHILINIINSFLSSTEETKKPELPLIGEYLMIIASILVIIAILRIVKVGRP